MCKAHSDLLKTAQASPPSSRFTRRPPGSIGDLEAAGVLGAEQLSAKCTGHHRSLAETRFVSGPL